MQVQWRNIVIVDYEVDFPTATNYELGLYSSGLQLFPRVILGIDRAWGQVRRPGIVDIPVIDYDEILEEFASTCLTSAFIRDTLTTLNGLIRSLGQACERLEDHLADQEPLEAGFLRDATVDLRQLMAFHVMNWVLPLDEILSRLRLVLGAQATARATLLSLLVPFTSSHVLDGLGLLEPAELNARAQAKPRHEDRHARRIALDTLSIWLQSNGNPEDLMFLTNLARLCRLAAEEEEQRRRIQNRWMAIVQKLPQDLPRTSESHETPYLASLPRQDKQTWNWLSDNAANCS